MSQFWDDLAHDLRDPEFRAAYAAESARLADTDPSRCPNCGNPADVCLCPDEDQEVPQ